MNKKSRNSGSAGFSSPPAKKRRLTDNNNEDSNPIYALRPSEVSGTILYDLKKKSWRLGSPVGKGSFGEIFLASDNIQVPVTKENAKYVVKFEPHSNGPLFVEIHFLLNATGKHSRSKASSTKDKADKKTALSGPPSGIPDYIASGSHLFGDLRYRFLILQRFDQDLHSLIKNSCVSQKSLLTLAIQLITVLENVHDKGYCHNDVKSQNIMISKCKYLNCANQAVNHTSIATIKSKNEKCQPRNNSGSSSEQADNDDDNFEVEFVVKPSTENEDFNDGPNTSNFMNNYNKPITENMGKDTAKQCRRSNPRRSCRTQTVNYGYLGSGKKIKYANVFSDDTISTKGYKDDDHSRGSLLSSTNAEESDGLRSPQIPTPLKHFGSETMVQVEAEHLFLIDFGLAFKYISNGIHCKFVLDKRFAHQGTLMFTSRDAHMGSRSRRSDLECLGYNLLFWSQGFLPWIYASTQKQHEKVHYAKDCLMTNVRELLKQIYGKDIPEYLGEFLHLVGQLAHNERPQYSRYRSLFEREYQKLGYSLENMCLDSQEIARTCVRIKEDHGAEKYDYFEQNKKLFKNNVSGTMTNSGTPFQEPGVSPKNLRSTPNKKK